MILTWDRRRRPRWRQASFGWDRTRRRKPPSRGRPSRPCAGRDRNWDQVSTSCAVLLLGHVHFARGCAHSRRIFHWASLPKPILSRTEGIGEPKNCSAVICLRPKRRRTLAAAMSLRMQRPSRPGRKNQLLFWRAYIGGEHRHAPHIAVAHKDPAEASARLLAGHFARAPQTIITP